MRDASGPSTSRSAARSHTFGSDEPTVGSPMVPPVVRKPRLYAIGHRKKVYRRSIGTTFVSEELWTVAAG